MSLAIREMQIKTIMWYHFISAVIKKTDSGKCCQDVEKLESTYKDGRNAKGCSHYGEQSSGSSKD